MWLLTSVLDKDKLSIKAIRELYKQRWGIEVEFRGLKQTLDKGELRCRTAARVKVELHWSVMAMAVAELFARRNNSRGHVLLHRHRSQILTRRNAVWSRPFARCVGV